MCLMEKLTFQEEEIMLIIWQVKEGVIKDFLNCMEEPRPPYTTVASIVKNLEKKGYAMREEFKNYDAAGNLNAIYLEKEFGGFAIHLLRRP